MINCDCILFKEGACFMHKTHQASRLLAMILLIAMLMSIGVDEKTASEDACRIEHYISDKTFNAIKAHQAEHKK